MRDACLIKLFLNHNLALKKQKYQKSMERLFEGGEGMKNLQDFRFRVRWYCDSDFIPFLSKLAPNDTISICRSQRLNQLRIDFNQQTSSGFTLDSSGQQKDKAKNGRRQMSVFLRDKKTLLVDHISKTISCDLFDLLKSSGVEDDNFDGQALELVNSNCVKEKQSL